MLQASSPRKAKASMQASNAALQDILSNPIESYRIGEPSKYSKRQ